MDSFFYSFLFLYEIICAGTKLLCSSGFMHLDESRQVITVTGAWGIQYISPDANPKKFITLLDSDRQRQEVRVRVQQVCII